MLKDKIVCISNWHNRNILVLTSNNMAYNEKINGIDRLVILVGMHEYVEGATRLQKYAFLSAMKIKHINKIGFYDDWDASHYGPFSASLAQDVRLAVKDDLVSTQAVINKYGFYVDRFAVTEKGKRKFKQLKDTYSDLYDNIITITKNYQPLPLFQLLKDVYYQYPKYARASTIRDKVAKRMYESDSYLNTQSDN